MTDTSPHTRNLRAGDLERVVELDSMSVGMRRPDFFRRRWDAMERFPEHHMAFVAECDGVVEGFAMAHVLTGEFGADQRLAILDALAVQEARRGAGLGGALVDALRDQARARGCVEIRTQVAWRERALVSFLAGAGFDPAAVNVLERMFEEE